MNKIKITTLLILSIVFTFQLIANDNVIVAKNGNEKPEFAVKKISKVDFLSNIMDYEKNPTQWIFKGKLPCVIDFYADWCGPCRITSPILEELAIEYKGKIDIYKVNVDNEKELSQVFGISGIPAFLYCPMEGKPSMTSGIARDKEQTKQMFRDNIDKLLLKNAK
jgi:thioredoxin 1